MALRPPISTLTDTLLPYPTLFRSGEGSVARKLVIEGDGNLLQRRRECDFCRLAPPAASVVAALVVDHLAVVGQSAKREQFDGAFQFARGLQDVGDGG